MLKALSVLSWGLKKTLLLTYNALETSIARYTAPVWNTNASDSRFKKIQTAQHSALRTATGAHKMASIDHLYQSLTLKVKDHSDMLSTQYLVNCLEKGHVCHDITTQGPRPIPMKDTLQTSLNCSSKTRHKQEGDHPESAHTCGRFGYSAPRQQQSTEGAPILNIGRGAETDPKTTVYPITATIQTLQSTAGLQA